MGITVGRSSDPACARWSSALAVWRGASISFARAASSWPGERLLILREGGELVLAEASPDAFRPIARAQILPPTVRAYAALSDGILYVRNSDRRNATLVALDLRP